MKINYLFALLFPIVCWAQQTNVQDLLTSSTWNIAYNISAEGDRKDEEDQEKIRSNWVKFNKDGTYEVPAGISGKTIGKWTYNETDNSIQFIEGRSKYRVIVEEISDLGMLLNYIDHGGFKIGLIHYVFIPKEKSAEEIVPLLTSGRWNIVVQRFDQIEDKTPTENIENTWFEFNADNTYKRSEVIGEETVVKDGTWFVDSENLLNLDAGEMTIYSVVGDKSKLILTSNVDGIKMIECRKAK